MNELQALLLGLLQGLTEYLPVSSSGHLTIAGTLMGVNADENLMFTIAVHVATVLSTLVILYREIGSLLGGLFRPLAPADGKRPLLERMNNEQRYVLAIAVSMVPIGIVGVFFKDKVEEIFASGLPVVGVCLLLTAALLIFSHRARPRHKESISLTDALIIGLSQACAVLPGLSRSGTTISTGLFLGINKEKLAKFSFLMVIPPILGEALLDGVKMSRLGVDQVMNGLSLPALAIGFLAAFISGAAACKWMIRLVAKGRLTWFAYYCAVVGLLCIILA